MKTAALIAEYNPFHNGHAWQLRYIKEHYNITHIIVVMSQSFMQRGDVAITDKFSRAFTAINNGADLVLGLPFVYSSQTAEVFAVGATKLISELRTDMMCFGCDTNRFEDMKIIAKTINNESAQFKIDLRRNLVSGRQYPAARLAAVEAETGIDTAFMLKPNNILALEYIRSMEALNSAAKLCPTPIAVGEGIKTASEIRKMLFDDDEQIKDFVPKDSLELLKQNPPRSLNEYKMVLKHLIISNPASVLSRFSENDESLSNRMKSCVDLLNEDIGSYIDAVSAKNFTKSKVRRALCSILTGYSRNEVTFYKLRTSHFARVLSANERGRELISHINKTTNIKLYPNINKAIGDLNEFDKMIAYTDNKAENIYNLFKKAHDTDLKKGPIII